MSLSVNSYIENNATHLFAISLSLGVNELKHNFHELTCILYLQVNLDSDPMEMAISPDIFAQLKQANPARFVSF